jgi:hypothetical protein
LLLRINTKGGLIDDKLTPLLRNASTFTQESGDLNDELNQNKTKSEDEESNSTESKCSSYTYSPNSSRSSLESNESDNNLEED